MARGRDSAGSVLLRSGAASVNELVPVLAGFGYQVRHAARAAASRSLTYYDSWDGELRRRGYELRKDEGRGRWELLADGTPVATAGGAARPASRSRDLEDRLARLVRGNPFVPHLSVDSSRRRLHVDLSSAPPLFLEVEELELRSVHRPGAAMRCLLVSAEDPAEPGAAYLLSVLRRRLCGAEARSGLLEDGLAAMELPLPGSGTPACWAVGKRDATGAAAAKVLLAQLSRLRAAAAGAMQDLDLEYVHEMRGAARTLRQAIDIFRPSLGAEAASHAAEELRYFGGKLGELRDQDVFLASLRTELPEAIPRRSARDRLLQVVERSRATTLEAVKESLGSPRYAAMEAEIESLAARARRGMGAGSTEPARAAGERAIRRALGRVRRARRRRTETLDREELHALRIRLRRLRYACEIYRPVFGGRIRRPLRKIMTCQDCLGDHQDAIVARERLLALAREARGAGVGEREVTGAIENLADRRRRSAERLRARFIGLWRSFPEVGRDLERCLRHGKGA